MEADSTTKKYDYVPTVDDVKRLLPELAAENEGGLKPDAARALFERIIAPIAGRRYLNEDSDLVQFIADRARVSDSLALSTLSLGFEHDFAMHAFSTKYPYVAACTHDLIRSVAVYLARTAVYWASLDENEPQAAESTVPQ